MKQSIMSCLVLALAACNTAPPPEPKPGCNPLVGDDCLSPYPSSYYEKADSTTATGVRVNIPDGVLPVDSDGTALMPDRLNTHDGVSPATPFIIYFKAGVNAMQLPTLQTLDQSVTPQSTVQVIEAATGTRLPVMAELDANAMAGDRQALLVRPQARLKNATRYIIALVNLQDAKGEPLVAQGFKALRDKTALSNALMPLQSSYEDIFNTLAQNGVARNSVTLAWDVTTASDANATGHLVAMRDTALGMLSSLTWTLAPTGPDNTVTQDQWRLRELTGTFDVPLFLKGSGLMDTLNTDSTGNPVLNGTGKANFVVDIPQCATTATGPLPVIVFGHGLFGTAQDELASGYEKEVGNRLCMVQIGTDWIGLSQADFPTVATTVVANLNNVNIVTDRLQQAHVNAQVLTSLFKQKIKDDPQLQVNGHAVTDASEMYYYGISDGGIQGGTYMALNTVFTRGVLNVPGCEWNLMMFRSADFAGLKPILDGVLPDLLDQQVALALLQPDWDYTDPVSFAGHLLQDPLPNTPVKQILMQESINDAEVPNMATRILARLVGVPGLDLEQPVFGITEMPAPLQSAYTQWDVNPMPVPAPVNIPPAPNGAHEGARRLDALQDQLKAFFTPTGQVTLTCNGPCNFPDPTGP